MNAAIETETKASRLLLFAWMETEKRLPAESKALIETHDVLFAKWREAGWPSPIPPELSAASDAIEADPLAIIPFKLRQESNQAHHEEWRKENAK